MRLDVVLASGFGRVAGLLPEGKKADIWGAGPVEESSGSTCNGEASSVASDVVSMVSAKTIVPSDEAEDTLHRSQSLSCAAKMVVA